MSAEQHTVPESAREVRLASRPSGWPTPENFDLAEAPVPRPGPGELLVRNVVMSVDPYMRGRMNAGRSYVSPFELGKPLEGGAVGRVVESQAEGVSPGDLVSHQLGWREWAVVPADRALPVPGGPEDPAPGTFLGVLGMTGLTAYVGLAEIAQQRAGDVVFVSGAAGAVGSVAGQIAALRGAARVVGSAGSPEKVRYLTEELGFDAAFDYKDGPVSEQLAEAAPDGIDVYFDNVGGDHLEAAIGAMRTGGRIAMCGAISAYNETEPPPGPRNLGLMVGRRITARGFIVGDHIDVRERFLGEVGEWVRTGRLRHRETTMSGLERAPEAFLAMLRGENIGKMLVEL
ncbi:NADP-dependent oxidoreductase [Actinoalloteichus sp. AHMU CJ021]|uniref:Enoyl reductase (ER) domain-containing protein n=1 Tax=Actinoalloteichus caeruleus DSM 43889 TaxID=1120930 RepID=A0ABT1JK25_ACTCY|nr:NADP-dependent oxidoreductase [Actinoalloteichus caeruleus]AUS78422.1 NADP-dependent oxidoreductase [Actinoalloteichus sp. AHMU CJ021]MCP2332506.1 hypothetical protein [Actinoalloteichus caeruleus DSM 43889]